MFIPIVTRLAVAVATFVVGVFATEFATSANSRPVLPGPEVRRPLLGTALPPSGLSLEYSGLESSSSGRIQKFADRFQIKPRNLSDEMIKAVMPIYPESARKASEEGTVEIEVMLSRTGEIITSCQLSGSSSLGVAALDAVQHSKFRPLRPNTISPVLVIVTYKFSLKNGVKLIKK